MKEPSTWIFHGVIPYGEVIVCARTLREACWIADLEPKKVGKVPDPAKGNHQWYQNITQGQKMELEE